MCCKVGCLSQDHPPKPNGRYMPVPGKGRVKCFVPAPLPPRIDLVPLIPLISEASNMIGNLNGLGQNLRNSSLLTKPQLLKEAVSSSRIEGIRVSLSDMYYYRMGTVPATDELVSDSKEVDNHADALEEGLSAVRGGRPIDLDLVLSCHKTLLRGVGGNETVRGELRTRQNYIAHPLARIEDAKYVPPSPEMVPGLVGNLLEFVDSPPLHLVPAVQCAIIHYQFEAIHPFEDGNGRIGRLLIPLLLADRRLLDSPLLYLSEYLERHKARYYDLLDGVSTKGEWIPWIGFILNAIISQAKTAIRLIGRINALRREYLGRTEGVSHLSHNVISLIDLLFETPVVSRPAVARRLNVTNITATSTVNKAMELGILECVGVYNRKKIYVARELYELLDQ